jgi:hypothetical protein
VPPTPAVSESAIGEEKLWLVRKNFNVVPADNLDQKEGMRQVSVNRTRHVRCGSEGQLSVKVRLVRKKFGNGRPEHGSR